MADETEDESELELDVEETPKSNKKLIIAIIAVVLLLNGGAASWFFLSGSGDGTEGSASSTAVEEKEDTSKLPLHYLTLVPEFVVNFGPGSRVRYLQLDIQIATRDESSLITLSNYNPVIRNDILVLLSGVSFDDLSQEKGKILLQKQILNTINKVLNDAINGESATKKSPSASELEMIAGPIENIYFISFIMQ